MPELALATPRNIPLLQSNFTPVQLKDAPPNGKAAAFVSIANAVGGAAKSLTGDYLAARELNRKYREEKRQDQREKFLDDRFASGDLSGMTIGENGTQYSDPTLHHRAGTGTDTDTPYDRAERIYAAGGGSDETAGGEGGDGTHVTDYGQPNDPYLDTNTKNGLSAIGKLRPDSMAVSPDEEAKLKAMGIHMGDDVEVRLSNGAVLNKHLDDRTSSKLKGRLDFYSPGGPDANRDARVVGYRKLGGAPTVQAPQLAVANLDQSQALGDTHIGSGALADDEDLLQGAPTPVANIASAAPAGNAAPAGRIINGIEKVNGGYVEHLPDGRKLFHSAANPKHPVEIDKMATGGSVKPSSKLVLDASGMDIDTDGMTSGQISKAIDEQEKATGQIRPSRIPVAQSLARFVVSHPTLKHYPTIREAKEAVDAGLANEDTGGFSDMALVEGFQRMVNPGATVRTQTMDQMLKAAGYGQYADLGFLMDHLKEGQKFSPETRQRLKKLADDIFERSTRNMAPQLNSLKKTARAYGITNPDQFIDNVMLLSPTVGPGGQEVPVSTPGAAPAAPATGAPAAVVAQSAPAPVSSTSNQTKSPAQAGYTMMAAPDGTTVPVKNDQVQKYLAKGAKVIQ